MGDDLKKYVDQERDRFDVYDEDLSDLWEHIDRRLDKESVPARSYGMIWKVAAVLLMISASVTLLILQSRVDFDQRLLYRISPELAEAELFYNDLIAEKMSIIQTSMPNNDFYKEDMEMLNQAYEELKNDLRDHADNQEVIEAMIANYKIRLAMLERILQEIAKEKDEEADQHIGI